jgi:hypothetical protein
MAKPSNKKDSLCICLTPLHVLTAEKVSETIGQHFDKGVYFSYNSDSKTEHYYNKMASFCKESEFVLLPNDNINSPLKHLKILVQRWKFFFRFAYLSKFKNVFLPTSYNTYLMILLAITRKSRTHTFDDGILNIAYEEIVSPYRSKSPVAKIYEKLTGVFYSIDDLVKSSTEHYSIYPASQNVCGNVKEISLLDGSVHKGEPKNIKRIFIGPAPEADDEVWQKVNNKIQEVIPDEFLPHPRDIHQKAKNVHYTQTHLIAEDYVISQLEQNPNSAIEVYGLQSSALIHLAKLPNVVVFSFIDNNPGNSFLIRLMSIYGVNCID